MDINCAYRLKGKPSRNDLLLARKRSAGLASTNAKNVAKRLMILAEVAQPATVPAGLHTQYIAGIRRLNLNERVGRRQERNYAGGGKATNWKSSWQIYTLRVNQLTVCRYGSRLDYINSLMMLLGERISLDPANS